MNAAILTVGDELLAGDVENTNASWLARRLTERGVSVERVLTVPDEVEAIAENVRAYAEAFDAVVVTGGLGGTPDDVTMEGVATAFDSPVEPNDVARADLERTLAAVADDYPDLDVDVEEEASIPAGARPLVNGAGLSPGTVVENVYVLPGIPDEMRAMFEDVAGEFDGDLASATVYATEPEANLVDRLHEVRARFDVAVGCYPDRDAGHNRLTVRGTDRSAVGAAAAWLDDHVSTVDGVEP